MQECTEVKFNAQGFLGLHARLDLPSTCLLERYVGEIVDEKDLGERNDLHMFLYDYGVSKLYVDANRSGSLTRFIRKVDSREEVGDVSGNKKGEAKNILSFFFISPRSFPSPFSDKSNDNGVDDTLPKANCCIIPINLDGEWQLFVELKGDIKAGTELILERYYGYHNEDAVWRGRLDKTYPNTINDGTLTVDDERYKQFLKYTDNNALVYDKLPDEHHFLVAKRCLSDWVELRTVTDKALPYCGQIGVYAACPIHAGTYIGEYTGEVFVCDGTSDSLYVAKYENSFEAEETDLVRIDGLKIGNEMRYINDSRNTGRDVNVQFILAWIGGTLHLFVVCIKDIAADEELLIDYGNEYWDVLSDWKDSQEPSDATVETK